MNKSSKTRRSSLGVAVRVKCETIESLENHSLINDENHDENNKEVNRNNQVILSDEAHLEYSEEVLEVLSPSLRSYKRRRSILGSAARVKTPSKADNIIEIEDNYDNTENETPMQPNSQPDTPECPKLSTDNLINKRGDHESKQYTASPDDSCSMSDKPARGSVDSTTSSNSSSSRTSSIASEELKCRPWTIADFILSKPIGKGKFGNVYLSKEKRSRTPVALKVLFKTPMVSAECVHNLRREVEIQCRLKHPNIVQLFGYFQDDKSIYLMLQYVSGGELFKHIGRFPGRRISEAVCREYIRDVVSAVSYMHLRHVIHRDIKPENILIDEDGRLRVADFGWAVHAPTPYAVRYTLCGTAEYLAPEMLDGSGHSHEVDLWALGVLMYELLVGRTPFYERRRVSTESEDQEEAEVREEATKEKTFHMIIEYSGVLEFPEEMRGKLSSVAVQTMQGLLQPQKALRTTCREILDGNW
eukprot:CAMPEP_0182431676 /NCGR_PEP_ID=MMETSP1167-20130531/50917_1 /TAXON_ID=2988 /ORGANISM="Mallomonas Sp, Strain CCMP3275" /LENGTH=472 /DNA_ID=CAMNT_0024618279 /DNA_START=7 /DNA_END=1422 /DNA_ORIENTATION=-